MYNPISVNNVNIVYAAELRSQKLDARSDLTPDTQHLAPTTEPLAPNKRRYTLSEKALAARRLNQEKATRAASDRRRLGNPTWAEKEAWRLNLLRARRVLDDDRTWKYAPCFRHGLTAISLERSLVLAGENPDEYRAHLARFDRLVEGLKPGPRSDPPKLARATALVAWRRLRALRLDREWTLRALLEVLQQAIRAREEAVKEPGDQASLGFETPAGEGFVPGRTAPDGLGFLGSDPLLGLGLGLESASCSWVGTWRALTRLNNRFDQLWCALVELLGEAPPFLPSDVWWERGRMHPSPIVEDYTRWPAEVLGNPLRSPTEIVARLADRGVSVKPAWRWNFHPKFRSLEEAENYWWRRGEERRQAERERLEEETVTVAGDPHYCLLGRARRAEQAGITGGASKQAQPLPLPETFEQFLALVERAFGPEPPGGPQAPSGPKPPGVHEGASTVGGASVEADASTASRESLSDSGQRVHDDPSPSSVEVGPGVVPSSAGTDPNQPTDDPGRVRHLAELLWQRVERVRERAEAETRRLAQLVDAYGDALGRREEAGGRKREAGVTRQKSEQRSQKPEARMQHTRRSDFDRPLWPLRLIWGTESLPPLSVLRAPVS